MDEELGIDQQYSFHKRSYIRNTTFLVDCGFFIKYLTVFKGNGFDM